MSEITVSYIPVICCATYLKWLQQMMASSKPSQSWVLLVNINCSPYKDCLQLIMCGACLGKENLIFFIFVT